MFDDIVSFIREVYRTDDFIPLHEPRFLGKEKDYLADTIDSTFVSSVGKYVNQFEKMVADFTGTEYAVATVNGTAALHVALKIIGVGRNDEVLTQPLTFIATCNAISYCDARPVFIDVDRETMGLCPVALKGWLDENTEQRDGFCINKNTENIIRACVPMHVFGHPTKIRELKKVCDDYNISLVEDAAESLGSYVGRVHTGTIGDVGVLSFNGNKIITTGGGGMIITNNEKLARHAKHITTTAKVPHAWKFEHDEVGFNYRLPNLNAALGCAQMEQLQGFIENKRALAQRYQEFFAGLSIEFVTEPEGCRSNYWLNAVILEDKKEKEAFLELTNGKGIMTRPIWTLMKDLAMYSDTQRGDLAVAEWLAARVVNLPSSVTGK